MAYIGVAKPTIAKNADGTYSDAFTCGKAIQIDVTPQYAEGTLYGDNTAAEYDKEFKYADVSLNTTTLPVKAHEIMFGHTVGESEEEVTFKAADEAGYVGFGFYITEKVDGKRKVVGTWLPKVKFTEGAESYKTKGDNIEYQTPTITGQAQATNDGTWKETKVFATEAEAQAWIDEKCGNSAEQTQAAAKNSVAAAQAGDKGKA